MRYESPRFTVHGSIETLTQLSLPSPLDGGNDPCRPNPPRGVDKQSGSSDLILGQASLVSCTASSA